MTMPRYILVDIDDTIISTKEIPLPADPNEPDRYLSISKGLPKLSWIIAQANAKQLPPLGFCTGREASYALGVSTFFREKPNYWSIVESGLVLFNPKTEERKYHPAFTDDMRKVFEEINLIRIPRLVQKHPFLRQYKGKEVNAAVELNDGTASLADCERIIRDSFQDIIDFLEINVSSIAVDISPKGIDKGTGVVRLAEVTGIPPSEMLLIDDSMGGKSAAYRVGYLACPANARPDFKELVAAKEKEGKGHESPQGFTEGVVESISYFTGVKLP